MHGIAQGTISELRGGNFRSGFVGAVTGSVAGGASGRVMGSLGVASNVGSLTAVAGIFGGLAAKASGGSFEDGAVSAAFTHLFNDEAAMSQAELPAYDVGIEPVAPELYFLGVGGFIKGIWSGVRAFFVGENITVQSGRTLADVMGKQRGAFGSSPPPLQRIHPDSTIMSGSGKYSYEYWKGQSTSDIIKSLRPGAEEALRVKPDGRIFNGNTRVKVLEERGYDINSLQREVYR